MSGAAAALSIRPARPADIPTLERLIERSARQLGPPYYSAEQTEAAIAHVFGVDSELVTDGTYLVAEQAGEPIGCGGWSRRRTLFGGDRYAARDDATLDPAEDPARIRAFFVAPAAARRGVGAALLARCEAEAIDHGFDRAALMATLPGVPFYARHGYVVRPRQRLDLGGVAVDFVPMEKALLQSSNNLTLKSVQDEME